MRFAQTGFLAISFLVGTIVAGCQFGTQVADSNSVENKDANPAGESDDGPDVSDQEGSLVSQALTEVSSDKAILLDVRTQSEWDSKHFSQAVHIPVNELESRMAGSELAKDKKIYVHCAKGGRAVRAASILNEAGYDVVALECSFADIEQGGFALGG